MTTVGCIVSITWVVISMILMIDTDIEFVGVYQLEESQYQEPQPVFTSHLKFPK